MKIKSLPCQKEDLFKLRIESVKLTCTIFLFTSPSLITSVMDSVQQKLYCCEVLQMLEMFEKEVF